MTFFSFPSRLECLPGKAGQEQPCSGCSRAAWCILGAALVLLGALQGYAGYSTSVYTGYVHSAGVCRVQGWCVPGAGLVYVGCSMGGHTGYSMVRILGSVLHAVPCTQAPV